MLLYHIHGMNHTDNLYACPSLVTLVIYPMWIVNDHFHLSLVISAKAIVSILGLIDLKHAYH